MNKQNSLQTLDSTITGLKQYVDIEASKWATMITLDDSGLSPMHVRFSQLLKKYASFVDEYRHELDALHSALLNEIELEQQRMHTTTQSTTSNNNTVVADHDEQPQPQQQQLDTQSTKSVRSTQTSYQEIEENVDGVAAEFSPTMSVASNPAEHAQAQLQHYHDHHDTTSVSPLKPMMTRKSKPLETLPDTQTVAASREIKHKQNKIQNHKKITAEAVEARQAYKYDAQRATAKWWYDATGCGPIHSSTVVYVGNIARGVQTPAVKFLAMTKSGVSMRQITDIKLKYGSAQYALVRFRSDVRMEKILSFIKRVNEENAKNAEQHSKNPKFDIYTNATTKTKSAAAASSINAQVKTGWKSRVFVRLNDTRRYYANEFEMFNDPQRNCKLFIRNFEILNNECHQQLTTLLLEFGALQRDIKIDVDRWDDPFCLASFEHLDSAIVCRNADIEFGGRWLEVSFAS
mmetsp:Transcript_22743/g.36517  ORF Transcript_22743/g.36517 Transcript_22743/m.36517 type:complete len:461 (-) Transcript_22743:241-1623(-)